MINTMFRLQILKYGAICTVLLATLAGPPAVAEDFGINRAVKKSKSDQRLASLMDDIWNWKLEQYPEFATFVGNTEGNNRWTDRSQPAIEAQKKQIRLFLRDIEQIDRNTLSDQARLDYDVLHYDLRLKYDGQRFQGEYLAINQLDGVQSDIPYTLRTAPRNNRHDYDNLLSRLKGIPVLIEQTIALLEQGRRAGITPPRVTLRDLPAQIDGLLPDNPEQSPLYEAFQNIPDTIPARQKETIRKRSLQSMKRQVYPAFKTLKNYLVDTYLPDARDTISWSSLPDGKAWYRYLVEMRTTTHLTPEQIHQTGLSEVRRIHQRMEHVIAESGFQGGFKEFVKYINSDNRFFFKDKDELVAAYRALCKQADPKMPQLFHTLPRLPYGVEPVAAHLEKSAPAAYYYPGSAEAARAGMFYVNTYDLKSRPRWMMPSLIMHETVPGHHMQIAIAQELPDTHNLRKYMFWTAYVEGWGLYAESLGEEIGFYPDTYTEFGRLSMEMWRAIRLVVDTGMHALGWTRQQAIDFFTQNSPMSEHEAEVEVDRYIVWAGQALAYKTGELKIRELRERAKKELGKQFDIRAFHDELLSYGALPLDILNEKVNTWITGIQKSARRN